MRRISIRAIGVFAFATTPAFAGTFTITTLTNPNRYEPSTLTINVGDTVTFTNTSGFHNVVSDADSVTAFRCANGCDGDGHPRQHGRAAVWPGRRRRGKGGLHQLPWVLEMGGCWK